MLVAHGGGEVAVAGQQFAEAELAQVGLVLGECRRDDGCAGAGRELDGEAADAARRADDQHRVPVGEVERVEREQGGDAGERRGAGDRDVDAFGRPSNEHVLRDGDQLGPASVVRGRVGV